MEETEKRKSVEIQEHATIKTKRPRNDVDLSKCIVCQEDSRSDSLVEKSSKIQNLFDKISKRASYDVSTYVSLKKRILLVDKKDEEKVVFHRKCYANTTHAGHISREKRKMESAVTFSDGVDHSTETAGHARPYTRCNTQPFNKNLCFFCQTDVFDMSLREVLCMETGLKIQEAVQKGANAELKVRLNTAINTTDARAVDVKYHLACYVKHVQRAKSSPGNEPGNGSNKETLIKSAELELLAAVDVQIRSGAVLTTEDIENAYHALLEEYGIQEKTGRRFSRRYLKDMVLSKLHHAASVPQDNPNKPHLIKSNIIDKEILTDALELNALKENELKLVFQAAKIIRNSILKFREERDSMHEFGLVSKEEDVPSELFAMLKWIIGGYNREFSSLSNVRRASLEKHALVNAQNIMYVTKSNRQMAYDPSKNDSGFRIPKKNENKQVIGTALQVRKYSRSSSFIRLLNDDGLSVPSYRALQIETALANEVINQLKVHSNGVNLLPFLQRGQFVCFHFDNSDFTIDTPDGKNQLHGGLIAVFQKASSHHASPYNVNIDLKSRSMQVQPIEFTKIQEYSKPRLKNFELDPTIIKRDEQRVESSLSTTTKMVPWQ